MKKRIVSMGLVVLLLTQLTACQRTSKEKNTMKVGVTLYNQYDAFLTEYMEEFSRYANQKTEESGLRIELETYHANESQSSQNDQVRKMIRDGCDVICVNLVDRTDTTAIIDMAEEAKIPIIFFNRELVPEDLERYEEFYYVGAKALESGIMQGELAVDAIRANPETDQNGDGVIQYAVIEGEAGHQDAIARTEYAISTMEAADLQLEKVAYAIANWDRDQAKTKAIQLLQQEDTVEVFLCNNDAMALGVIDALDSLEIAPENRPLIFGIDGTREGLEAVKNGEMTATVYNDSIGQADAMLELAYRIVLGEDLADLENLEGNYIRLPYEKVNQENVAEFQERMGLQ